MSNLLKSTFFGFFWTSVLRVTVRVTTILKTAILARILLPVQFGFFGIATIALSLLEILTETGINVFLLQEKDKLDKYIDTAWVISLVRGSLIALLIFVLSPYISIFFNSPQAIPLLRLVSLVPLIRGFINPACVVLLKELKFKQEFFYRFSIVFFESILAIVLVSHSPSAISLVWSIVFSAIWEVLLSFWVISPRPRFSLNMSQAKNIINRGKWVTSFGLFDFLFTNGDNIVIGRMVGSSALGIYQNAYKISTNPLTEVIDIYYKVTFPTFVKIADRPASLRKAAIRSVSVISIIMISLGFGIYLLAEPIVLVLLGPNWSEAVPVIKVLAFLGVFRGLSYSFNSLFLALHKQKYVTAITFTSMAVMALSIIPAVQHFGIVGAALAALLGSAVSLPVALVLINRQLKLLK